MCTKIDYQLKFIKRDGKGHFLLIKEKIYKNDISILNIYSPNTKAPTLVKEILLKCKLHIEPYTLMVWDFNTPLSTINKSSRQKVNRDIMKLTNIINQMDLGDTYKLCHAKKNVSISHHLMGSSLKLTIYSMMKEYSDDTKTSKLCLVSYQTTMY